jgi:chromosome segregation ATPase
MANPRELAEQAFALLKNALRDSEARASELDDQLKRKRAPKTRLEEQLDVLTHRLEKVEAERVQWQRQAGHLEEVAEAERVKVAQLKKKLEIAESGPEKLTKKEVNFWRAKAESFDSETHEYKDRLASLRREIMERDTQISQLENAPPGLAAEYEPVPVVTTPDTDELNRQIELRDQWLRDLRLELHELRTQASGQAEPPLETLAEIETLRHQITSLERALSDAHNGRAAAQADLTRATQDVAARERAAREAETANERAQSLLQERDHRLVEVSAEIERLRNDERQREEHLRSEAARHEQQSRVALTELEERSRAEAAKRDEEIATLSRELEELRGRAERDRETAESAGRELDAAQTTMAAAQQRVVEAEAALARSEAALAERATENSEGVAQLERLERVVAQREQELEQRTEQLQQIGERLVDREQQLASLRETLQTATRDVEQLRDQNRQLEAAQAEVRIAAKVTGDDLAAAKEQIAGLEAELKEEKEHAENLGELANERREHMTKLTEQLEEAEERYAEADWRLGKALYFEKLVKRRKGLVEKLLAALRAKMKANVALKAGLDGLRTYKASAEVNQQKLLQGIDKLKAELADAKETIERQQAATHANEAVANAEARAVELEGRLNTQAELIQSLETELKAAKRAHKNDDEKSEELAQLRAEVETKSQIIAKLQEDADEQQRKLAKLRGSESETLRLKALKEQDRGEIDALQREVSQLREALERQSDTGDSASAGNPELEAAVKARDESIKQLKATVKEHEASIKKLTESADGWKRKYQFLAADAPEAYKSTPTEH